MEYPISCTKQKIKEVALILFSQRGFSAVSVRNICGKVGIKESTIYYYFKNKQDIFDALLNDFETITSTIQNSFNSEFFKATKMDEKSFISVGLAFLNEYLLNEKILKLLRMLMIEQHVNTNAAVLLRQILFENPLQQNEQVFQAMIASGCFIDNNSKKMAFEYYAPIFLAFQRYFSTGEPTEESKREANTLIEAHLKNFYKQYSVRQRSADSFESL